jgi:hypothetical protein
MQDTDKKADHCEGSDKDVQVPCESAQIEGLTNQRAVDAPH